VFKEWYNLSKTTFLIAEKNMQIEQIIGFVKLVLDINQVTYVQLDEAIKYGCLTIKSYMICKRFVWNEATYCHIT